MPNLDKLVRNLLLHRWDSLDDWVDSVERLADLSDPEIDDLSRWADDGDLTLAVETQGR